MAKSPLFNISFTLCGRVIDNLIMVVFYALVARCLGQKEFGIFVYSSSVAILVINFSDLGFSNYTVRELARDRSAGIELFGSTIYFRAMILFCCTLLLGSTARFIWEEPLVGRTILMLTTGLGLFGIADFFLDVFRGIEEMHKVVRLNLVYKCIITITGVGVLSLGYGLIGLVTVYILAGLVLIIICARETRKAIGGFPFSFYKKDFINALKKTWIFAVPRTIGIANLRLGLYALFFSVRLDDIGVFGASLRLIEGLLFIPWAISIAAFPNFARLSQISINELENGVGTIIKILGGLILPIALVTHFFSKDIIHMVYGEPYATSAPLLRIHMWMCFFYFNNAAVATFLQASDQQHLPALQGIVCIILHALFLTLFMPTGGLTGAALAALAAEAISLFLGIVLLSKKLKLKQVFSGVWKIALAGLGMAYIFYLTDQNFFDIYSIFGFFAYLGTLLMLKPFTSGEITWLKTAIGTAEKQSGIDL